MAIDDVGVESLHREELRALRRRELAERRYELARDLARGFASGGQGWASIPEVLAKTAVEAADALLDLLVRDNEPESGAQ